jgi:DNA-binding beta-propeller fold protein YncE
MTLELRGDIALPPHETGGFDHADVHPPSGRVFVAHTALGQVEILDGAGGTHAGTVPGCPEASGVLYAPEAGWMVAAARGTGDILILDAASGTLVRTLVAGSRPNGMAWDPVRQRLLVADVGDNQARLVDPVSGSLLATTPLPGRPRWCLYDRAGDRFLVNILAPARVVALAAATGAMVEEMPVAHAGPHGLALDEAGDALYVACDSGDLAVLDRETGQPRGEAVPLAGPPDVLWLNPPRQRLYVAIGQPGVVQVVDTQSLTTVETVRTEEGAHTLTFDEARQRLYVFLPRSGRAAIYAEVPDEQTS